MAYHPDTQRDPKHLFVCDIWLFRLKNLTHHIFLLASNRLRRQSVHRIMSELTKRIKLVIYIFSRALSEHDSPLSGCHPGHSRH